MIRRSSILEQVAIASLMALAALLVFTAPLFAQGSYREFEKGLNLSEPQRREVEGIKQKYIGEWRNLKGESMRKRLELQELSRDPAANRERAQKLRREIDEIDMSRYNLYQRYRGEVGSVLTPDQRGRYERFCDDERQRMMQQQGDRQRMMQQHGDRFRGRGGR